MGRICEVAGAPDLIVDSRVGLARQGVIAAVRRHDTPVIFDWLFDAVSYQGVSDSIAWGYMEQHGRVRWHDISGALAELPSCPKLRCYWAFLFTRDLAGDDIVGWIDDRLAMIDTVQTSDRPARLRQALLEPFGHIYGVSNKVLAMALSGLLLAGDAKRPAWIEAGTVMIAVDTLVHNFLHRTGIL